MNSRQALARVRKLCLSLPEASERLSHGAPTFFARKRVFVMFVDNHHGDGRLALWCNAPEGAQEILVNSDPDNFFIPPYVGVGGWIGLRLDRSLKWADVTSMVNDANRVTMAKQQRRRRAKRS